MRSGGLRYTIEILEPVEATSAMGGVDQTWQTYRRTRAEARPVSAKEFHDANQVNDRATLELRFRYVPGVTEKMRVICAGVTYQITGVPNALDRRQPTVLLCESL